MKIIVDAFGGDNAPLEILKGCAQAHAEYGAELILTGDETIIARVAKENDISLEGCEIVHAPDVISMEDDPSDIRKSKSESSMAVGLKLLAQGRGDAFVSAGSTGALVVGATMFVKRIKGIKRAALAPVMPSNSGCYMLIDSGANVECRPEMLQQFGVMGSTYMNRVIGVKNPRVGLINVGMEDSKGGPLQHEAFALLKKSPVNFIGNVEARDVPDNACDVAVCDGFTGNVVLKLTEGVSSVLMGNIKAIFKKNFMTKIAAMMLMGGIKELKKKMDYNEYGGAPLLGIAKPVFKAHGSSKATALKNAIRMSMDFAKNNVIGEIESRLEDIKTEEEVETRVEGQE